MSALLHPSEVSRLMRAEARWLEQARLRLLRAGAPRPTSPAHTTDHGESR